MVEQRSRQSTLAPNASRTPEAIRPCARPEAQRDKLSRGRSRAQAGFFDVALGGQAIIVEAKRVVAACLHAPEARHRLGLNVGIHVADMQLPETVGGGVSIAKGGAGRPAEGVQLRRSCALASGARRRWGIALSKIQFSQIATARASRSAGARFLRGCAIRFICGPATPTSSPVYVHLLPGRPFNETKTAQRCVLPCMHEIPRQQKPCPTQRRRSLRGTTCSAARVFVGAVTGTPAPDTKERSVLYRQTRVAGIAGVRGSRRGSAASHV